MDSEANIVAAVLAFREGWITDEQLSAICREHARNPDRPMLDRLAERGWLDPARLELLRDRLAEALTMNSGDARATLASVADPQSRGILTASIEIVFPPGPSPAVAIIEPETREAVAPGGTVETAIPPGPGITLDHRSDADATLDFSSSPTRRDAGDTSDSPAGDRHALVEPLGHGEGTGSRYTRTRLHASGGVGQVWLARDSSLLREVALKELRPDRRYTAKAADRFVAEARITGALQHPGIIPIYELDTHPENGRPFYTMRFVAGRTLAKSIAEYHRDRAANPMALRDLLSAFEGVCQAVAFAHSKGVIHRDLKPGNVVIGDFGEALLLDWGLAKFVGEPEADGPAEAGSTPPGDPARDRTVMGTVKGTPAYMAPEQARGDTERIGPPSDVYGLGAILYEILTGALPFSGSNTTVLLDKVREGAPTPPRKINPEAPPALQAICSKAMAREPGDRYPSAADLAADIRRWLADEPVSAYREPPLVRAGRWARKHKTGLAAALTLLVVGTVALAIGNVLVRAQRDEAIRQEARARDLAEFARQSAEQMYLKFSEYWLEDSLDPLQRQTLEQAGAAFARFAELESADDGVRLQQGRTLYQLGDVEFKLGRLPKALDAYGRALTLLDKAPDGTESRRDRSYIHLRIAQLRNRQGDPKRADEELSAAWEGLGGDLASALLEPEIRALLGRIRFAEAESLRLADKPLDAEPAYRAAIGFLEPIVADNDPPFSARIALVSSLDSLGLLLHESGRNADAVPPLLRARDLGAKLLADFPTSAAARESLARTWNTLGLTQADLKDADKARAAHLAGRDLYKRLADDHPSRPEYRRGLARSLFNLGNLLFFRDGAPGAEAASLYRQGIAVHRGLDQPPDDFKYRRDLGRALLNLGSFALVDGAYEEAAIHLQQAQDLFRTLSGEFPEVPDLQGSLALSLGKIGDLARARGDLPAAVDAYGQALTEYEALIARHANVARYRREQAQYLNNLGLARIDAKEPDEARTAFTKALGIYADEYAKTKQSAYLPLMANSRVNRATLRGPDAAADYDEAVSTFRALASSQESPAIREALAIALYNQGRFRSLEKLPDPEGPLDEAIGRLSKIVESRPESSLAQSTLGNALERRARIVQDTEPDRALGLLQSALYHQQQAVAQSPRDRLYRNSLLDHYEALARLQQRRGDLGTAAALAETLAQVDPNSAATRLLAARLLAGLSGGTGADSSQAAGRASRAVAMLTEAVAKGGIDRATLANDPDFAPIAGRDDFRALLNPPKPADGP